MWSLVTDVPPGKKSRTLHSTHTMLSGIRLIPRHLAKLPEHILTPTLQANNWTRQLCETLFLSWKFSSVLLCLRLMKEQRRLTLTSNLPNLQCILSIKCNLTCSFSLTCLEDPNFSAGVAYKEVWCFSWTLISQTPPHLTCLSEWAHRSILQPLC